MYDVVIVGGGPAGLSAALVLGRCRRKVLVCDAATPRNAAARALHGYLTRDGIPPLELIRLGAEELQQYGVERRTVVVADVNAIHEGFEVRLEQGGSVHARMLLIATGVEDPLPPIPGLEECYGISVHHCPYCDGWEVRDRTIAVLGAGTSAAALALSLKTWSDHIVVCTSAGTRLNAAHRMQLAAHGITLHQRRLVRVEHENGWVKALVLEGDTRIQCDAVFITAPQRQQSELARKVGCQFNRRGTVKTDNLGKTCIPGVYVAGDASRDVQSVVVAAAEGAKAAVAINTALQSLAGLALAKTDDRQSHFERAAIAPGGGTARA